MTDIEFVIRVAEHHEASLVQWVTLEHNGHEIGEINSLVYDVDMSDNYANLSHLSHLRVNQQNVILQLTFQDGSTGKFIIPAHLIVIEVMIENEKFKSTPSLGGEHRIET